MSCLLSHEHLSVLLDRGLDAFRVCFESCCLFWTTFPHWFTGLILRSAMESPTLWKGLLYIIRHWETFGIHLLIKALEDGAKELISHQSAQADCSLKYFLPITRYSRGWFCPKTQIVEAAIQPANQMARIHWKQSRQRRWQHASGDI